MRGLTWSGLKRHPSLIPLFFFVGGGVIFSSYYLFRLATKSPEVSWRKKANPEPFNEYEKKQYKFYSPNLDYSKLESDRPKF